MSKYLNTIMQKEYKNIKIIGLLNNANCERNGIQKLFFSFLLS